MMKLVVALNTASKPSSRQSGSVNSSRLKTGRPSMTVLSKRMRRPVAAAAADTLRPVPGDRPLVGGDDVHAERNASRTWPVAAGWRRRPRTPLLHDGELDEDVGARGGEELGGRPRPPAAGPARRPRGCQHLAPASCPAGSSRLPWRVPARADQHAQAVRARRARAPAARAARRTRAPRCRSRAGRA